MWLFTTIGFYSVVMKKETPDTPWHLRAREEQDLRNLIELCRDKCFPEDPEIHVDWRMDYTHRILLSQDQYFGVMEELTDIVDYPNFKDAAAKILPPEKVNAYGEVWGVMADHAWMQVDEETGKHVIDQAMDEFMSKKNSWADEWYRRYRKRWVKDR